MDKIWDRKSFEAVKMCFKVFYLFALCVFSSES